MLKREPVRLDPFAKYLLLLTDMIFRRVTVTTAWGHGFLRVIYILTGVSQEGGIPAKCLTTLASRVSSV